MSIALSQTDEATMIDLKGAIDIACASELKAVLLEACGKGKRIVVKLRDASDLDVTGYQLLWAARREAQRAGFAFELAGQLPARIRGSLAETGLHEKAIGESGE